MRFLFKYVLISFPEIYFLKRELKQTDFIVVGTDLLDERDSILLKCILMMCVNLVSFDQVAIVFQNIMYIKKNPLHFRMCKKNVKENIV